MSSCLVQQLFRQKKGEVLDPALIDDVLFPMLRPRKHPPNELLTDIKMVTGILIKDYRPHRGAALDAYGGQFNVPTFTPKPLGTRPWACRRTSKIQREGIRHLDWGAIEIINELRELNYPLCGYDLERRHLCVVPDFPVPGGEFVDMYISLEEDLSLSTNIRWGVDHRHGFLRHNATLIESRAVRVNNFMEYILVSGQRLKWGCKALTISV